MSKFFVAIIIIIILSAPVMGTFPHLEYDWEGDNANENPPTGIIEACNACHFGAMAALGNDKPRKKCEDCHTVDVSLDRPNGPYEYYPIDKNINFSLRRDYSAPLVYSHLKVSKPTSYSTCLNYDVETGEGACHGVSDGFAKELGGYFAFNQTQDRRMSRDNPYILSVSKQFLPDSTDCLFCHFQPRRKLARAWGDAPQVIPVLHAQLTEAEEGIIVGCLDCHLKEGSILINFHSAGIYMERKKSESTSQKTSPENIGGLVLTSLLLVAVGIFVFRKFLSKKRKTSLNEKD